MTPAYDLTPSVANNLIGLSWLGSTVIPTRLDQVLRLAETGGIDRAEARDIYQSVESTVLGGWRETAKQAGVPKDIAVAWEKEILPQTQALRENAAAAARPKVRTVPGAAPVARRRNTPRSSASRSSRPKL